MAVLYVDEYGAAIRSSGGRITIEKDGKELAGVRIQELDCVVIQDNCSITSAAVRAFLTNGVDAVFLSSTGEYVGKLEPVEGKNVILRRLQYRTAENEEFCLALARRFAAAKLANMRTVVMRYARASDMDTLGLRIQAIKDAAIGAGAADSLDQLLGYEGTGSREYFSALQHIIESPFTFTGRNRRPPLDPVNAMLGFSYALLENYVERGVSACGLDPYCGFFHQDHYGRQSLVLDLMEELRPVVADSVVLNCCSRLLLDPQDDFERRDGGVYLNETGRQKFFKAFYTRINESVKPSKQDTPVTYESLCRIQARKIAECIRNQNPDYKPFLIK